MNLEKLKTYEKHFAEQIVNIKLQPYLRKFKTN